MRTHQHKLMRAAVETIALAANLQVLASNTTLRETIRVAREEKAVRGRETGGEQTGMYSQRREETELTLLAASRERYRERNKRKGTGGTFIWNLFSAEMLSCNVSTV